MLNRKQEGEWGRVNGDSEKEDLPHPWPYFSELLDVELFVASAVCLLPTHTVGLAPGCSGHTGGPASSQGPVPTSVGLLPTSVRLLLGLVQLSWFIVVACAVTTNFSEVMWIHPNWASFSEKWEMNQTFSHQNIFFCWGIKIQQCAFVFYLVIHFIVFIYLENSTFKKRIITCYLKIWIRWSWWTWAFVNQEDCLFTPSVLQQSQISRLLSFRFWFRSSVPSTPSLPPYGGKPCVCPASSTAFTASLLLRSWELRQPVKQE